MVDLKMEAMVAALISTGVCQSEMGPAVAAVLVEHEQAMRRTLLKESGKKVPRYLNQVFHHL